MGLFAPSGPTSARLAEGSGSLDRVIVDGDRVTVETLRDGLREPTAVAKLGGTAGSRKANCRISSARKTMVRRTFRSKSCRLPSGTKWLRLPVTDYSASRWLLGPTCDTRCGPTVGE
jgi:hypothetical protein